MSNIKLDLQILDAITIDVEPAIESANQGAGQGDEVWRHLWLDPMRSQHVDQITSIVDELKPNCKNVLVLGIGGSAIGTKALHAALSVDWALDQTLDSAIDSGIDKTSSNQSNPALFVLDNIDPHTVRQTIAIIKDRDHSLQNTVVVVVSKSGNTAEILALCMVALCELPSATYIAITGDQGALYRFASEKGWRILPVPEGVGGRFSVLSPVGLFPAAMCGIDIEQLLEGAQSMDERCRQMEDNPAAKLASALVTSMQAGRGIHVMMSYTDRLLPMTHWFVQLWAESLGKQSSLGERIGATPIAAVGASDQHSMLQLWREGPLDKVIGFVEVSSVDDIELGETTIDSEFDWLCSQTLGSLLHAELNATRASIHEAGQSTWTLTLPTLNAHHVGQFIALWQITVAMSGRLLDINPYDQAGVELGKKLTREAFE